MQFNRATIAIAAAIALCAGTASAGETMYVTSYFATNLLTIDPTTGNVTSNVPITGAEVIRGVTCDGVNLYAIDGSTFPISNRTFLIDPSTGHGTVVGDIGFNWNHRGIESHPQTGVLYAMTANKLYTLSKITGAATFVANITDGTGHLYGVTALAINLNGEAYVTDDLNQSLFRLDLATGVLTWIGDLNVSSGPGSEFQDLAFDASGQLWGIWYFGGAYKIDTTNATATLAFNTGTLAGIAFKSDCQVTTYCTAKINSLGCMPQIGSTGLPSVTVGSGFNVSAVNIRNNKNGLLFYGVSGQAALPFQGGTLCVKAQVRRTPSVNSGGTPAPANDCSGVFSIDMMLFSVGGLGGNPLAALTVPGTIVDTQWWGRDPGFVPPFNTTLSDALEYRVCP
jgi:hypothetical protein